MGVEENEHCFSLVLIVDHKIFTNNPLAAPFFLSSFVFFSFLIPSQTFSALEGGGYFKPLPI